MTGPQWGHLVGDCILGALAGYSAMQAYLQRRWNEDFRRALFQGVLPDLLDVAQVASAIDPLLMQRLLARSRSHLQKKGPMQ